MRILRITALYPPNVVGGAEIGIQRMSYALSNLGEEVHVATLQHENAKFPEISEFDNSIKLHPVKLKNLYWPYSNARKDEPALKKVAWHLLDSNNIFMASQVRKLVDKLQPDVVLTHNLQGFSTAVLPAIAKTNTPIIHVLHDCALICPKTTMYKNGAVCGMNKKRCFGCKTLSAPRIKHTKHISAVVAVSNAVLKAHQIHGMFNNIPTRVIYNALPEEFNPSKNKQVKKANKEFTFGYISRVEKAKGIETLLKACENLSNMGHKFKLLVAGNADQEYKEHLLNNWPLDNVEYLGFIKPKSFYEKIDALVFPTEMLEALGNVAFEAFSHTVPVIGSNRGGVPETIQHGRTGYVFEAGNHEQLTKYMQEISKDTNSYQQMSKNAFRKSFEYVSENRANEYKEFINSVTNSLSNNLAYA